MPMTFVATVAAIRYANAKPVLVDIDPVTLDHGSGRTRARNHAANQGDRASPSTRSLGGHGGHPRHRQAPRDRR